jgi:hypothetical protein
MIHSNTVTLHASSHHTIRITSSHYPKDHEDQKEKGSFEFGLSWEEIDQVKLPGEKNWKDRDTDPKSELLEACKIRKGVQIRRIMKGNTKDGQGNEAEIFQYNCGLTFRHQIEDTYDKSWATSSDDPEDVESGKVYDDEKYKCYDGSQPSRLRVTGSKVHLARMGLYELLPYGKGGTEKKPKGPRPCYKCQDNGNYLYYSSGYWCIGLEPGSSSCALKYRTPSEKLTPDRAKQENQKEKPKHGIRGILVDPFVGILLPNTQRHETCMRRIKTLRAKAKEQKLDKNCGRCSDCKKAEREGTEPDCMLGEAKEQKHWEKLEDGVWFSWKGDRATPVIKVTELKQSYELAVNSLWPPHDPRPCHTWGSNYLFYLKPQLHGSCRRGGHDELGPSASGDPPAGRWCIGSKRLLDEFERRDNTYACDAKAKANAEKGPFKQAAHNCPLELKKQDGENHNTFVEHCKEVCRFFRFGGFSVIVKGKGETAFFRHESSTGSNAWSEVSVATDGSTSCTMFEFNKVPMICSQVLQSYDM